MPDPDERPTTPWSTFASAAPKLAGDIAARFQATGLCLMGTLRADGFPRISPVEPLIHSGQLYLGMMWQSYKGLDLLRDPRVLVHTTIADKNGTEGEGKVYGRAVVIDGEEKRAFARACKEETGYFPDESPFHLFAVDITQTGWVKVEGDQMRTRRWRPGDGEPELIVRA